MQTQLAKDEMHGWLGGPSDVTDIMNERIEDLHIAHQFD